MNSFIAALFVRLASLFFWGCLINNIGYALLLVLWGSSPLLGLASAVGGVLLTAIISGLLALMIENNRLL